MRDVRSVKGSGHKRQWGNEGRDTNNHGSLKGGLGVHGKEGQLR